MIARLKSWKDLGETIFEQRKLGKDFKVIGTGWNENKLDFLELEFNNALNNDDEVKE